MDVTLRSRVGDLEIVLTLGSSSFTRVRVGADRTILARR